MKALILILALVLGPKLCPAESINLGRTVTAAVGNGSLDGAVLYGRSSDGALRQIVVGTDGGLTLGGTVTLSNTAATAAKQDTANTALAGISTTSGTDQTSYTNLTVVAYGSWLTESASSYNLTTIAGVSVPLQVWLNASQGGAAVKYFVDTNATAPSWLDTRGWYAATTTIVQVSGRWAPGHHLHVISVGSEAVTGTLTLVK